MRITARGWALTIALTLAGCAATPPSVGPAPHVEPAPVAARVIGPPATLPGFAPTADAHEAFCRACPAIARRQDRSGLTVPADWQAACADTQTPTSEFFDRHFIAVRLGDGKGLATGYFEPEITGSLTPVPGGQAIYRLPPDLLDIDLGAFAADLAGRRIRGRFDGKTLIPYYSRAEIENGVLAGRHLELAWANDPVDLFFLQIQGSGRLRLGDGQLWRIGYAGQNGHPYTAIGRLLRERGQLEKAGMAEIRAWLAKNPAEGRALMRENASWIFFRRLPDSKDGPIGALGVPLIAEANAAVDLARIPPGAPLFATLEVEGQPWRRLLVAADTGGAIRGANRIDIFWGHGDRAARIAGALAAPVNLTVLLPRLAAERLSGQEP